jgi:hypothetical protein
VYLIPVSELLKNDTRLEEVFWNFIRLSDKERLTLSQNPHFYTNLPTSSNANWHGLDITPTEENWHDHHTKGISVLTNIPGRVFFGLCEVPRAFDNVWIMTDTLVFKCQYFSFASSLHL